MIKHDLKQEQDDRWNLAHGKNALSLRSEGRARLPANILIVDDDIDSALRIESVFSHLGCATACALNWHEARQKLCALKLDIIIFDWILDQHTDAGDIIKLCGETFAKFPDENGARAAHRPKIITCSSLLESEIELRQTPYFDYLEHWHKPIQQRDLLTRALGLLKVIGR